jgi:hypothetical protein
VLPKSRPREEDRVVTYGWGQEKQNNKRTRMPASSGDQAMKVILLLQTGEVSFQDRACVLFP